MAKKQRSAAQKAATKRMLRAAAAARRKASGAAASNQARCTVSKKKGKGKSSGKSHSAVPVSRRNGKRSFLSGIVPAGSILNAGVATVGFLTPAVALVLAAKNLPAGSLKTGLTTNPWYKAGFSAVITIAGGMALRKFAGAKYAAPFVVGGLTSIAAGFAADQLKKQGLLGMGSIPGLLPEHSAPRSLSGAQLFRAADGTEVMLNTDSGLRMAG